MIANCTLGRRARVVAALGTSPSSSSAIHPPATHDNDEPLSPPERQHYDDGGDDDDDAEDNNNNEVNLVHTFLVGTAEARADNEIFALKMDAERRAIQIMPNAVAHQKEIWDLAAKGSLIASCWGSHSGRGISFISNGSVLDEDVHGGKGARAAAWNAKGDCLVAVHYDDGAASVFRVTDSSLTLQTKFNSDSSSSSSDQVGLDVAWDPHNADLFLSSRGPNALVFDVRNASDPVISFQAAAGGKVRSVDVNPNRSHICLAAGDDGALRFFDTRHSALPIQTLYGGHTHWVTRARYNPFHDQLVLTSSTDGAVCLWRAASVSSAPLVDFDMDDEDGLDQPGQQRSSEVKDSNQDMLVKSFQEHQDSVYGIAWSAIEAWTFASLSYDGKFVVRNVPSVEKYKILLN